MEYSTLESGLITDYPPPAANPFVGGIINAYGSIYNPYGAQAGWIDSYGGIHEPIWGNEIASINPYGEIQDAYGANLGTINPYGAIISPYSY